MEGVRQESHVIERKEISRDRRRHGITNSANEWAECVVLRVLSLLVTQWPSERENDSSLQQQEDLRSLD